MAFAHLLVLTAALLTLLGLPCAAAVALRTEGRSARQAHGGRRDTRSLRRLDRGCEFFDPVPRLAELPDPSIEQIAYDLRRLDRQRHSGPTQYSQVWLAAVLRAYDDRLRLACRCLGVDEHLQPLKGLDREMERVRVEERLEAAGLAVRAHRH